MTALFKNATVYRGARLARQDILVRDGRIVDISDKIVSDVPAVDCKGLHIFPGFTDVHVHLREPGFSYKETIRSGTLAAAHGGYTTVCSMPNVNPVPQDAETLRVQTDLIRSEAVVRVAPYGAITRGQQGKALADFKSMAADTVGFSDDGRGVQDEAMMLAAMTHAKALDKPIAAHCEVNALLHGGYIHDGAYAARHGHRGISAESEYAQIERDLRLARQTGCRYHVCHVSTARSVELIRAAKADGVDVTCETAPHYLCLCDEDLQEDGRFKMNPPLRAPSDRDALVDAFADGTVDMIATDHAPHSTEEKSRGLQDSAMGVVGLETAFAALYTNLVKPGRIPLARLVAAMTDAPNRRFRLGVPLEVGQVADFCVYDLDAAYTVDPDAFLSQGRATPFAGSDFYGMCRLTVCAGRIVWRDTAWNNAF